MQCLHCQGKLVRRKVDYTASREGFHLIIDNVPAWVCEQCGEPLFEEGTVDAIQEMLREVSVRMNTLAVPLVVA